jgi:hypothetical protein
MLELNDQGEHNIEFLIPETASSDVITVAMKTFIGYSQEKGQSSPVVSSHSVPMLKLDEFEVEFSPEFSVSGLLIEGVENKIYFQVVSSENRAPIEFHSASLIEVKSSNKNEIV